MTRSLAQGIGDIVIRPGIQDRETLLNRQERERRELHEALQSVLAVSIEQAEEMCAARKQCEADLAQVRQELVGYTPADPSQKLGAGVEALRNHMSVLGGRLDAGLQGELLTSLPALPDARAALKQVEQQERLADESVALARAPLAGIEDHHTEMIRAHARVAGEKTGALNEQLRLTTARDLPFSKRARKR
jgi:hypothetical protein